MRIVVDPGSTSASARVAGTRLPVQAVLALVREGLPSDGIVRDAGPDLTVDEVRGKGPQQPPKDPLS
jgi:uncharacterized protein (DUF433 family)